MPARPAPTFDYDAELYRYHEHLQAAVGVRAGDHVLDIGCGTGLTTRAAARAAAPGTALGVDVSAEMVARARSASQEEGLTNVGFLCGDVQTHPFSPASFDLGVSRFGTMFFTDPVAAFTNIARSLRPGARLVQLVWQHAEHQEWSQVVRAAFGPDAAPTSSAAAFSLADPATVGSIMTAAGFVDVDLVDLREPVYYGRDAESALAAVRTLRMAADRLDRLPADDAATALDRLRTALAAHQTGDGVLFDSRAWLVTARRGGRTTSDALPRVQPGL